MESGVFRVGPIGASIAKLAYSRKNQIDIIGAVDVNPALAGEDLSELIGGEEKTGVKISQRLTDADRGADIVLHATSSFLSVAESQLIELCEEGLDVVSDQRRVRLFLGTMIGKQLSDWTLPQKEMESLYLLRE